MRADQLGRAIGAHVHVDPWNDPNPLEFDRAHFVIIVKRLKKRWKRWIARVQNARKPIVWDCVDFWQQPEENDIGAKLAIKSFWARKGDLGPKLVIAGTKAMAEDCAHSIYLPHHHRVGLSAAPVKRAVELVGYEGNPGYLMEWHDRLTRACERRGWRFVVNPDNLADMDIVVALRAGQWDGWTCRRWKSGVKYANSIAAGRPVITQTCAAFTEMRPPGTAIETDAELNAALDHWSDYGARLDAATDAEQIVGHYHLETVAERYLRILREHMR